MNEIKIFEFEENNVETVLFNDEPLFNPLDVGKCLDITEDTIRQYVSRMDEDERVNIKDMDLNKKFDLKSKKGDMGIWIRESGVYELIFKSRKPEAKKFRKWVTKEVLPSIRKTGKYELESTISQQLENTLHGLKILTGIHPGELAEKQNESARAKLANLINDIAKRKKMGTSILYEKLYFLFASETGFHIPELAKNENTTEVGYLKKHELSAEMLYDFALNQFYDKDREVILVPEQENLDGYINKRLDMR
jgi:prophage antirepressor-like protein